MTTTIKAGRFNTHGKHVETVDMYISVVNNTVYLHIQGEKTLKSYSIGLEQWKKMNEDVGL